MKVLFISPNSPEISVGGIERYVRNLIDYFSDQEDDAIFLLPADHGKEGNFKKGNAEIIYRNFLNLTYKNRPGQTLGTISQDEIRKKSRDFFDFLLAIIKERKIEIVDAQNFHLGLPPAFSLMLNMACFSNNIPIILTLHSFPTKPIHEEIINNLLWQKIVCVSKSLAGDCFNKGTNIDRLVTKYLGVNTGEFKSKLERSWLKSQLDLARKDKIILCASRVIQGQSEILKAKGIVNLIEAFSKISPRYANLKLVIAVGKPPDNLMTQFQRTLKKLEGYIKLHNVQGKVFFREFTLSEMPLVYDGADIFVLASENETLGQVYLEAMSSGVPVIGTNTGGVPEIISHNYNGFLIQPNNASLLALMIEDLLNNRSLRQKFIKRGSTTVKNKFSSEKLFKGLSSFLRQNLIAAA